MLDEIFNKVFKISPQNVSKEDSIKYSEKYLINTGKRIALHIVQNARI